ncbi:MAG: hypothetical protein IPN77_20100 [Sandaracinaceae bacterium]|nr:hypothetical protein [Sandaracinaceae bacterium]
MSDDARADERAAAIDALLTETYGRTRARFEQERRVLSFNGYLDLCAGAPAFSA